MKLLSDKIQEFIDWLELETDFGDWDRVTKTEVQMKLIEFMTSENQPDLKQMKLPFEEAK